MVWETAAELPTPAATIEKGSQAARHARAAHAQAARRTAGRSAPIFRFLSSGRGAWSPLCEHDAASAVPKNATVANQRLASVAGITSRRFCRDFQTASA